MAEIYRATKLNAAQAIVGYNFVDPSILWESLQAPGAPPIATNGRNFSNGNKRLALLGDAVLKTVLLGHWYKTADVTSTLVISTRGNKYNCYTRGGKRPCHHCGQ